MCVLCEDDVVNLLLSERVYQLSANYRVNLRICLFCVVECTIGTLIRHCISDECTLNRRAPRLFERTAGVDGYFSAVCKCEPALQ